MRCRLLAHGFSYHRERFLDSVTARVPSTEELGATLPRCRRGVPSQRCIVGTPNHEIPSKHGRGRSKVDPRARSMRTGSLLEAWDVLSSIDGGRLPRLRYRACSDSESIASL